MNALLPLFERLPDIYRIRDAEQGVLDQLRAYLAAFDIAFGALHANIDRLYDDSSSTREDWVIPISPTCSARRNSVATRARCAPMLPTPSRCAGARAC